MPSDPPAGPPGPEPASTRSDGTYRPLRDPQVILLILIVLGTFAVMAGGLGTGPPFGDDNESSGPVFPVFDYDGEDRPEAEALTLAANRTVVDPSGAVEFSVTAADKPVSNVTLQVEERRAETDQNGTAVLTFDEPGTYEVVLSPTTSENATTERVTIRVRRHQVDLAASVRPSNPVTGQNVTVAVTRADTGAAVAGTVVAGGRTVKTGDDGRANVTFSTAATHTVTVRAPQTETERFTDAATTVVVDRRVVGLNLVLGTTETRVDDPVQATVTRADTGAPVNATVTVENSTTTTGADGQTNLSFSTRGTYAVTVEAPQTPAVRFDSASTELTVEPKLVDLRLAVNRSTVPVGERVTFTLRRTDTGERVAGTVDLFGTPYRTGEDGRLRVAFQKGTVVTAVGAAAETDTTRFVSSSRKLTVLGPDWAVTDLQAPDTVQRNESVAVTATVRNDGTASATEEFAYRIGDRTLATRTVTVDPGETTEVQFTVDAVDLPAGDYTQTVSIRWATTAADLTITANRSDTSERVTDDRPKREHTTDMTAGSNRSLARAEHTIRQWLFG
ncbi:CARDB domain-containing protein [Haloarchaeobius sp. DYHT-AS-18]|uniref:CARDB domain-containing protein n=1 Tax=Haloarchaeobius sp. DYHT-AS-18 TaxID=3446117 RepID=UPI003EBAEE5F